MINRGMSLEAIAALLGHRSMRMTLTYARISDRTVAEEYFRVTQAVEASYESGEALPASVEGANMRRIAAEHRRLLGNGHCTRPTGLDCTFESVCERCGFFETGPQFLTILRRQRDDAVGHGQEDRVRAPRGLHRGHRRRDVNVVPCPSAQVPWITHVIAPWGRWWALQVSKRLSAAAARRSTVPYPCAMVGCVRFGEKFSGLLGAARSTLSGSGKTAQLLHVSPVCIRGALSGVCGDA